jgi:hypothetical protein
MGQPIAHPPGGGSGPCTGKHDSTHSCHIAEQRKPTGSGVGPPAHHQRQAESQHDPDPHSRYVTLPPRRFARRTARGRGVGGRTRAVRLRRLGMSMQPGQLRQQAVDYPGHGIVNRPPLGWWLRHLTPGKGETYGSDHASPRHLPYHPARGLSCCSHGKRFSPSATSCRCRTATAPPALVSPEAEAPWHGCQGASKPQDLRLRLSTFRPCRRPEGPTERACLPSSPRPHTP